MWPEPSSVGGGVAVGEPSSILATKVFFFRSLRFRVSLAVPSCIGHVALCPVNGGVIGEERRPYV